MKALVYLGPRKVKVQDMPDAAIERATDVLVRITSTNICGSDLHMYESPPTWPPGEILGHENLGQVLEVGGGGRPRQGRRHASACRSISAAASARTARKA